MFFPFVLFRKHPIRSLTHSPFFFNIVLCNLTFLGRYFPCSGFALRSLASECQSSGSFATLLPLCSSFWVSCTDLAFRLTLDKEFEEIEYIPERPSGDTADVLPHLPDYLQENIFFENSQAPKFLARFLESFEALR